MTLINGCSLSSPNLVCQATNRRATWTCLSRGYVLQQLRWITSKLRCVQQCSIMAALHYQSSGSLGRWFVAPTDAVKGMLCFCMEMLSDIQPGYIVVMSVHLFLFHIVLLSFSRETLCQHALVITVPYCVSHANKLKMTTKDSIDG